MYKPKSVSVKCPRTGFRIRLQQRKLPWAEFREGFFGGCRVEMDLRSEQTRKGLPGRDTGDRGGVVRLGLGSQHCFAVCPRARHLTSGLWTPGSHWSNRGADSPCDWALLLRHPGIWCLAWEWREPSFRPAIACYLLCAARAPEHRSVCVTTANTSTAPVPGTRHGYTRFPDSFIQQAFRRPERSLSPLSPCGTGGRRLAILPAPVQG